MSHLLRNQQFLQSGSNVCRRTVRFFYVYVPGMLLSLLFCDPLPTFSVVSSLDSFFRRPRTTFAETTDDFCCRPLLIIQMCLKNQKKNRTLRLLRGSSLHSVFGEDVGQSYAHMSRLTLLSAFSGRCATSV